MIQFLLALVLVTPAAPEDFCKFSLTDDGTVYTGSGYSLNFTQAMTVGGNPASSTTCCFDVAYLEFFIYAPQDSTVTFQLGTSTPMTAQAPTGAHTLRIPIFQHWKCGESFLISVQVTGNPPPGPPVPQVGAKWTGAVTCDGDCVPE